MFRESRPTPSGIGNKENRSRFTGKNSTSLRLVRQLRQRVFGEQTQVSNKKTERQPKPSIDIEAGANVAVFSMGEPFDIQADKRFETVDNLFTSIETGERTLDDNFFGKIADTAVTAMKESRRRRDMHSPEKITPAAVVGDIISGLQWEHVAGKGTPYQKGRAYGQYAMMFGHIWGYQVAADHSRDIERHGEQSYDMPTDVYLTNERHAEGKIAQAKAAGEPINSSKHVLALMTTEDFLTSLRGDNGENAQDAKLRVLSVGVTPAIVISDSAGLALFDKRLQNMKDNLQGDQYDESRGIIQGVRDLLQAAEAQDVTTVPKSR